MLQQSRWKHKEIERQLPMEYWLIDANKSVAIFGLPHTNRDMEPLQGWTNKGRSHAWFFIHN